MERIKNVVLVSRLFEEAVKGNDTLRYATKKPEDDHKLFQLCKNIN